jgi:hypothetical protein
MGLRNVSGASELVHLTTNPSFGDSLMLNFRKKIDCNRLKTGQVCGSVKIACHFHGMGIFK